MFDDLIGREGRCGISVVLCLGLAVSLIGGCKDSAESIDRKEAARSLDEAARRVMASHQQVALTPKEIAMIQSSPGSRAIIGKVVDRLSGSQKQTDQLIEQISELSGKLREYESNFDPQAPHAAESESLREITKQIKELNAVVLGRHRDNYNRIIDKNHAKIASASAVLQASPAHFGTQLLLGAVQLTVGRDLRDHSRQVILEIQAELNLLGRLSGHFSAEMAYAKGLPSYFPYEAARGNLRQRLNGDSGEGESLQNQLNDAVNRMGQYLIQKEQAETSLAFHRQREQQIHKEILALMQQADQAQGDEKYELIEQAHQLRSNTNGRDVHDGIYYESQTELLENKLDIIKRRLSFEQLRQTLLTETIDQIKQSIEELEDSPFHADILQGLQKSRVISGALLEKLHSHLEAPRTKINHYHTLRAEAAKAYKQSQSAYLQAGRLSRGDSNTTRYARQMAETVRNELAHPEFDPEAPQNFIENPPGLWQEDVLFYEGVAEVLEMLVRIEGLREKAGAVREEIVNKANEAEQAISDLPAKSG
ncbi:MAG: hypothetical protein IID32_11040 [Planctomycetes bacterium]|nr:hypothetical protein [Planctomycetota bacterium]